MADQSGTGAAWMRALLCLDSGEPRPLLVNAIVALRTAPEWAGKLWFDVFHQRAVVRGAVPWAPNAVGERVWDDDHDRRACEWLQYVPQICIATKVVTEAVDTVAREQRFHPVVDYLHRCRWDGEPRLDEWAIRYLGAADTEFCRAAASRWMLSAVARVMDPGCKADCALILEGQQGTFKSTAIRALAAPWFTDELAEFGSKDAAVQLAGAWIIELAELSSMRGSVDRIKGFMSRATDRYRPPYGRRVVEQPRQCVFAGTVNDERYLPDETGNRRFWPIKCGHIDLDGLRSARDQLWAEARDRFLAGEVWHLDTAPLNEAATEEQAKRHEPDPWQEPIEAWLAAHQDTSVNEILRDPLFITTDKFDQRSSNRVARCLQAAGWERYRARTGKVLSWRYRRDAASVPIVPSAQR